MHTLICASENKEHELGEHTDKHLNIINLQNFGFNSELLRNLEADSNA